MTEIEKLSNIEYTVTEEVLARQWLDAYSKRHKLLQSTDWTQLADCHLPQNLKNLWKNWRHKVRSIKKSTVNDPKKALNLLESLQTQSPDKSTTYFEEPLSVSAESLQNIQKQINESIIPQLQSKTITVDDISNIIEEKLKIIKEDIMNNIIKKLPNDLDEAKKFLKTQLCLKLYGEIHSPHTIGIFLEALDYKVNSRGNFPLLQIHANHFSKSLEEIADSIINAEKKYTKDSCEREIKKLQFEFRIESANSLPELETLNSEIFKL